MLPNSRLLRLAEKSRLWLALTISLGFFSGLLTIGQARFISQIVSRVFLDKKGLTEVWGLMQLTLVFFTLRALLSWLSSVSAKTIAVQVKSRVRILLLNHLEKLGPAFTQREQSGEISATIVEGVEALDAYFSQYLPQLVLSALVPLTILVFVFPTDLLSGLVLLVTAPLIPFFMYLIGKSAQTITDRQFSTLSRLAAKFLDSLHGLTTLKLFNQAQSQTEKIKETSDQYRKTTMKVLQVTFLSALALELLATLSTAIVAVEIGLRLLYFQVTLEQALFLLMIAPEFYIPLRQLGLRFHAGMEGQSAAVRIFEILDTDPIQDKFPLPSPDNKFSPPLQQLTLDKVSFSYPGEDQIALNNISLTINQGDQIALVGESGAGKSTLANLILGFFPPGKGEIRINGELLIEDNLAGWRSQIAWVPQEPALFQDTIAANIRLARPDADLGAVVSAASAAHLAEFIDSLPEGYETLIGEGGARLSGGEAQRLALARAFLKDAPILIMDEPTSQLDPVTESQLADSTRNLMEGRTVITIAHRLNTIYKADRILVLQEGSVVEDGSHQELIKMAGIYNDLVNAYTGGIPVKSNIEIEGKELEIILDSYHQVSESPRLPLSVQPTLQPRSTSQQPSWQRLAGFLSEHWVQVLFSVLLGFLTIGSSIGLMGTSAWLISTAALHPSIATLQIAIVGVRFFGILRGISRYFERLVSHNVTFNILTKLRVWFYKSLVPLAPARLLNFRFGDLLSRIISDIKSLEDFYVRSAAPPLVALLIGLITSLFLGRYHPAFGILLGGFFILSGLILPLLIRILAKEQGVKLVLERSRLTEGLVNFVHGLPDLIVYGQSEGKQNQLENVNQRYNTAQLRLARISGLNAGLTILLSNLAMWLTLITAIPLIQDGEIPGVMLAALALLTLTSFEAVQPLPQAMETLSISLKAGSRLFEVVDAEPLVVDPVNPASFPTHFSLAAENLSFTYPGSSQPALDGINFCLREGETLAIVGPSGGGKSTLTNLLLRFWGDYQGKLLLGEEKIPLTSLTQEAIRQQISVVSQNGYLFHDTIQANIALGNPGAGNEEIITAAKKARIHKMIHSLPDGYHTVIGERGQRLSAGERQRILISRAVLKNAPIFILDEPTANLDPLTEREVLDTLFEILKNKTALLVTHRLVGLAQANQILVLNQGRIVERGTETKLLAENGLYRVMWSHQNRILHY
jgi:ATP-binding cassette subfamily C protein CydCD